MLEKRPLNIYDEKEVVKTQIEIFAEVMS